MILKAFSAEYFKEIKKIRKKPIIFFNGCFDILHFGHFKLINAVKNKTYGYKGVSIVAINSDESVKLQNKSHPLINSEQDRAKVLKELGIDYVIIFDEQTPLSIIMNIMPDVVMTTLSYYKNRFLHDDLNFCTNHNIEVDYIDEIKDYSTTSIYNKIEEQVKAKIRESI